MKGQFLTRNVTSYFKSTNLFWYSGSATAGSYQDWWLNLSGLLIKLIRTDDQVFFYQDLLPTTRTNVMIPFPVTFYSIFPHPFLFPLIFLLSFICRVYICTLSTPFFYIQPPFLSQKVNFCYASLHSGVKSILALFEKSTPPAVWGEGGGTYSRVYYSEYGMHGRNKPYQLQTLLARLLPESANVFLLWTRSFPLT